MPPADDVVSDSLGSCAEDGDDEVEEEKEMEEVEEDDGEEEEDDSEEEEEEECDDDEGGEEDEDSSQKSEFGDYGEDLKCVSSAPASSVSIAPINTSNNGNGEVLPGKKVPTGAVEYAKEHSIKAHGGHWNHLSTSISAGTLACIRSKDQQYILESMTRSSFMNGKPDSVVEKESSHSHTELDLQSPAKLRLSGKNTPQRRSRSSSPCDAIENMNKKTAIRCDFFAKGWCVRGNSCKFLHQKDGAANSSQVTRKELAGPSGIGEIYHDAGLRHEIERLKASGSCEPLEGSVKSQLLLQRALVQAYGADKRDLPTQTSPNRGHIKAEISGSAGVYYPSRTNLPKTLLAREESKRSFVTSSFQDKVLNESKSAAEEYLYGKYFNGEKVHHEMPEAEYPSDMPFSKGVSLANGSLVSEYKYHPSSLSEFPSYQNCSSSPFAYDKSIDRQNHLSHSLLRGSSSPFRSRSPLNPSFSNPLHPVGISASLHSLGQAGNSCGSEPLSTRQFENHAAVDLEGVYYNSRASSLPRISSPFISSFPEENRAQYNRQRNLLFSSTHETRFEADTWEPSVPFRSAFCSRPSGISCTASQYDPILDSTDPPSARSTTFGNSHKTIIHGVSNQTMSSDPIASRAHSPGDNAQNHLNSSSQPNEGILGKTGDTSGISCHAAVVASPEPSIADGRHSSIPKEDDLRVSPHLVDDAITHDENRTNLSNEADNGKSNESKSMRIFHSALVEFLKVLVKPYWKEGRLSKDAHKMIIKKAAEKVLGALQAHHIPSTAESIDLYLSLSCPKLLKLVEGYVEKYKS